MKLVQPIRKVAQIQKMKQLVSHSPRNALLLEIGFHTALRVEDILSMRVADVAEKIGERWQSKRYYTMTEGKTRKSKQIEFVKSLRDAIVRHVTELDYRDMSEGWLFPSPYRTAKGKCFTRQQVGRIVKKAARDAGVSEPVACHSLRKSFGYHAFRNGVDVMYLKELFNHVDLSITKRYIGITQDELNLVYQRVGSILR